MSTPLYSFQTLGVTPLTLLASAGGMAAVFKRQILLPKLCPGPPVALAKGSSFGGAETKSPLSLLGRVSGFFSYDGTSKARVFRVHTKGEYPQSRCRACR